MSTCSIARVSTMVSRLRAGVALTLAAIAADRSAATTIEYSLTLSGCSLGALGVASGIGIELGNWFDGTWLEICRAQYNVCTSR